MMWVNNFVLSMISVVVCSGTLFGPPGGWPPYETTTEEPWNGTAAPALANPCQGVVCYGGRTCAVGNDHQSVCVCLNQCYSSIYYTPICGSDNKTYENYCFLQLEECITNTTITSVGYGTCPQKTVCDGFNCSSGKSCRVDPQLNRPVCVCDLNCYYDPNPVCGSDNLTYANVCELEKAACESDNSVTVVYNETCSQATVCDGFICSCERYCAVGDDGQPICVCNTTCPMERDSPVCASDGKTYVSSCQLQALACLSGATITVLHSGICYEGSACEGFECPSNEQCSVDGNNEPICVCTRSCGYYYYYEPVCGSDGQTYANDCYLNQTACIQKSNLTVVQNGTCPPNPCLGVLCPTGMHCEVEDVNSTKCVCGGNCPTDYYYPVCGSDNRTYDNDCVMAEVACKSNTNITTVVTGICPYEGMGCEQFQCPSFRHCELDAKNNPSCVCNKICTDWYEPNCGSDNITYYSYCELQRFSCMNNSSIMVQYYGTCSDSNPNYYYYYCWNSFCPQIYSHCEVINGRAACVCDEFCPDIYAPVCGNDKETYDNNCVFRMRACNNETNATYVTHQGTCESGPGCEGFYCDRLKHCELDENKQPVCVCNRACPTFYDPQCGSDNRTYGNNCELQRAACLNNSNIYSEFPGTCEKGRGCYGVSCPFDRYCVVDDNNLGQCVCDESCWYWDGDPNTFVCGSDNETYGSVCFLRVDACLRNTSVSYQMAGRCLADDPCNVFQCVNSVCVIDENLLPKCVCNQDCGRYQSLLCGSDNRTYLNFCELQKQSCLTMTNISVLYYGGCYQSSLCNGVNCTQDTTCGVVDDEGVCVCSVCPSSYNYYYYNSVCGSDNVTYSSQCDLDRTNCLTNSSVTQKSQGTCHFATNCDGVVCPSQRQCALDEENNPICVCTTVTCDNSYYYYNPVCGSDGITYMNYCELNRQACFDNTNTTFAYGGHCD